jgi:hypothetical protein
MSTIETESIAAEAVAAATKRPNRLRIRQVSSEIVRLQFSGAEDWQWMY